MGKSVDFGYSYEFDDGSISRGYNPSTGHPPQTQEQLDAYIKYQIEEQRRTAQTALSSEQERIKAELEKQKADAEVSLGAQARDLDNAFAGFMTGAIAPAYKTDQAGVTVRDHYMGQTTVIAPALPKQEEKRSNLPLILAVGAAAYYFFSGKEVIHEFLSQVGNTVQQGAQNSLSNFTQFLAAQAAAPLVNIAAQPPAGNLTALQIAQGQTGGTAPLPPSQASQESIERANQRGDTGGFRFTPVVAVALAGLAYVLFRRKG